MRKSVSAIIFMSGLLLAGILWWNGSQKTQASLLSSRRIPSKIAAKGISPLAPQYSFEWINEKAGIGKIKVDLVGRSFRSLDWRYDWELPPGVSTQDEVSGLIQSLSLNSGVTQFLQIERLDPSKNQNTILRLTPVQADEGAVVVVIPSRSEQTLEGQVMRQRQRQGESVAEKLLGEPKRLPAGLQF